MVVDTNILFQALNDDDILSKHIEEINIIVKKYPYFQTAWALSTRYLVSHDTFFSSRLQQTAARSIDRSLLFEFVNKKYIRQQETKEIETKEKSFKTAKEPVIKKTTSPVSKETIKQEEKNVVQKLTKKNEDPVKKEVSSNKEKPVKIIRPIPRMIKNAIPKKLVKPPVKEEKKTTKPIEPTSDKVVTKKINHKPEKDKKPDNTAKSKIETNPDNESKPKAPLILENTSEQQIQEKPETVDKQPVFQEKKNIQPEVKLSYAEWLKRFNKQKKKKNKSNIDLIEKFLKERPKIVPKRNTSIKPPEIIEKSVTEKQMLMTETLANLYVKQKKYEKAIQAFRILSLKYPKKSSYFANQIKEIKQKLK